MLGWTNTSIASFLKSAFGSQTWDAVLEECGIEGTWTTGCPYPDEDTLRIIDAAARILGASADHVLEAYGSYMVGYIEQQGYGKLLQVLGPNAVEFLSNLNALHLHLSMTYPAMQAPAFRCSDITQTSLLLHYQSTRRGLGPMVVGLLKTLAPRYWGHEVEVELVRSRSEAMQHAGSGEGHDIFQVRYERQPGLCARVPRHYLAEAAGGLQPQPPPQQQPFLLASGALRWLFPFHLVLDRNCSVLQAGDALTRLYPAIAQPGAHIGDFFALRHPTLQEFEFESLATEASNAILLVSRANGMKLKGQMVVLASGGACNMPGNSSRQVPPAQLLGCAGPASPPQLPSFEAIPPCLFSSMASKTIAAGGQTCPYSTAEGVTAAFKLGAEAAVGIHGGCAPGDPALLFLGSPRLSCLDDLQQMGLFLSDIPLHDLSRDWVLLAEQRQAEADLKDKFEQTNGQLQDALRELRDVTLWLDEQRQRADTLLYQMLPPGVAQALKAGERAPASEHAEATILFSDICGFTEIAAQCSPLDVCAMLDELYHAFDRLLEERFPSLYKVETIGDAYMLVGNVTSPCHEHADQVLEFAVEMHRAARRVASPLGAALQIRVGVHSGPVVSGVVGKKMPRFCLFGDTVNSASRMESHGLPGHVHISAAAYACVRRKECFSIRERGVIQVKGKGPMTTYLIAPSDDASALGDADRRRAPAGERRRPLRSRPSFCTISGLPAAAGTFRTAGGNWSFGAATPSAASAAVDAAGPSSAGSLPDLNTPLLPCCHSSTAVGRRYNSNGSVMYPCNSEGGASKDASSPGVSSSACALQLPWPASAAACPPPLDPPLDPRDAAVSAWQASEGGSPLQHLPAPQPAGRAESSRDAASSGRASGRLLSDLLMLQPQCGQSQCEARQASGMTQQLPNPASAGDSEHCAGGSGLATHEGALQEEPGGWRMPPLSCEPPAQLVMASTLAALPAPAHGEIALALIPDPAAAAQVTAEAATVGTAHASPLLRPRACAAAADAAPTHHSGSLSPPASACRRTRGGSHRPAAPRAVGSVPLPLVGLRPPSRSLSSHGPMAGALPACSYNSPGADAPGRPTSTASRRASSLGNGAPGATQCWPPPLILPQSGCGSSPRSALASFLADRHVSAPPCSSYGSAMVSQPLHPHLHTWENSPAVPSLTPTQMTHGSLAPSAELAATLGPYLVHLLQSLGGQPGASSPPASGPLLSTRGSERHQQQQQALRSATHVFVPQPGATALSSAGSGTSPITSCQLPTATLAHGYSSGLARALLLHDLQTRNQLTPAQAQARASPAPLQARDCTALGATVQLGPDCPSVAEPAVQQLQPPPPGAAVAAAVEATDGGGPRATSLCGPQQHERSARLGSDGEHACLQHQTLDDAIAAAAAALPAALGERQKASEQRQLQQRQLPQQLPQHVQASPMPVRAVQLGRVSGGPYLDDGLLPRTFLEAIQEIMSTTHLPELLNTQHSTVMEAGTQQQQAAQGGAPLAGVREGCGAGADAPGPQSGEALNMSISSSLTAMMRSADQILIASNQDTPMMSCSCGAPKALQHQAVPVAREPPTAAGGCRTCEPAGIGRSKGVGLDNSREVAHCAGLLQPLQQQHRHVDEVQGEAGDLVQPLLPLVGSTCQTRVALEVDKQQPEGAAGGVEGPAGSARYGDDLMVVLGRGKRVRGLRRMLAGLACFGGSSGGLPLER